jgi:hypothetical protein
VKKRLLIALLMAVVLLPGCAKQAEDVSPQVKAETFAECNKNMLEVIAACRQYTRDNAESNAQDFRATMELLVPNYLPKVPVCPAGGTYAMGDPFEAQISCSVHGAPKP